MNFVPCWSVHTPTPCQLTVTVPSRSSRLKGDPAGDTLVKTKVIQAGGQQPIPIDYSMEKTGDGWKVYDVTVAGVSLVTNYRSTFNSQVSEGGSREADQDIIGKK